jgi:hypothetical protein
MRGVCITTSITTSTISEWNEAAGKKRGIRDSEARRLALRRALRVVTAA